MELLQLPAFKDNYIWVLCEAGKAIVVDPGDARPVIAALEARGLELGEIWATHHHPDHVGGAGELLARWPGAQLLASVYDAEHGRIAGVTRAVREGDAVTGGRVLDVPGHTHGHVAYLTGDLLFSGDVLFGLGCGRLFEGTAATMQASLAKIAALPPSTRVCCGHEYTRLNARWALEVEPDNQALQARVQALPAEGSTVPLSLAEELATNPMLHWEGKGSPAEVFARTRAHRNDWR